MVCCILSDNGGEFSNGLSRDGVELLVTKTATTAAESLWFKCLVECHNSLIQQMILKIADSSGCSWRRAMSAQNVLHGNQGISPIQLVFGSNTSLPSVLTARPLALGKATPNQFIADHLNALHAARKLLVQCKSS